jgi:hypothetical protein
MYDWILTYSRLPARGQAVDWLTFDGREVSNGWYSDSGEWRQTGCPDLATAQVAAWRPTVEPVRPPSGGHRLSTAH